jgi:23S rRNA (guanine745-N1)-methyltransferase
MASLAEVLGLWRRYAAIFSCPVCRAPLATVADPTAGLLCPQDHRFDFSAKGYVNLLLPSHKKSDHPGYDKDTLQARRRILQQGLFDPLAEVAAEIIEREVNPGEAALWLDAGCGEGHLLGEILSRLPQDKAVAGPAIGFDISKVGVQMGSQSLADILWCVGNINRRLPLQDESLGVVTNLLAPANLGEFHRVLQREGLLIKVFPGDGHLIELRAALYEQPRQQPLENEAERTELSANFAINQEQSLSYQRKFPLEAVQDLVRMSPLFWKAKKNNLAHLLAEGLPELTVDLKIIVGRNR